MKKKGEKIKSTKRNEEREGEGEGEGEGECKKRQKTEKIEKRWREESDQRMINMKGFI